jgi:UDPglucose--hexose-1-phosphate uridylyltransferase
VSTDWPHRRYNPLTGQWVLVSPQRTQRPWQGRTEAAAGGKRPPHDPRCYLCAGNERAGGVRNPEYTGTFVFDNDFPALMDGAAPASPPEDSPLLRREAVHGVCRVVCFSPRHDLSLAELSPSEIAAVIDTFAAETASLGQRYQWVQAFENKGEIMGCSNPHPHGQIWATEHVPMLVERELRQFDASPSVLADYLRDERERVVEEDEHVVALVPYWAVWPFETLVATRRVVPSLLELSDEERSSLARVLERLVQRYDRLFDTRFPYSMGLHQTSHFHVHFYPPLLRSASVRKFMVGYELLAEPQRDLTPEDAAARLRAVDLAG